MHEPAAHLQTLFWQIVAGGIFLIAYALIATDKVHKTKVALAGAALFLVLRIVTQDQAFTETAGGGVSWNTIFLLAGMMVIVNIIKRTGVLTWLAIRSVKLGRGDPYTIAAILCIVTAVTSAFLDNLTTVLFMAPVTFVVAQFLGLNPVPLLICEIIASNIGGTATLIGDPPNIMIGSAAGLGFMTFVKHLTPVVIVTLLAMVGTIKLMFGREWKRDPGAAARLRELDEREAITDWPLLRRSGAVMALTVGGFVVHEPLHLQPATVALAGAALLLLITASDAQETLAEIEWGTLFFFLGLFIMVTGLVKVGLIAIMADGLLQVTGGNIPALALLIVWFSAVASSVLGSIPFVATMNPLIIGVAETMQARGDLLVPAGTPLLHAPPVMALWWALALGACLGANATIIGAAANVAVAGIAESAGHPITFRHYLKYGVPLTVESLLIASVYLYWRYLLPL